MGSLIAIALLALLLVGLLLWPGFAIALLGLLVVALGIIPHVGGPPLPELDAFRTVLGIGSNPPVVVGIFIIGFGRLMMLVQKIARRAPPAAAVADHAPAPARRDVGLRREDRL